MMGLQAAIKSTTKRKYEIETDCEAEKKEEGSPPKSLKFSEVATKVLSPINNKSNTNNNNISSNNNGTVLVVTTASKSIKSDIIPPETHQWGSNEPIVDSISKLQAVTETWSNSTLSTIPFNCTSSTLTSLAQTAENITRSTLATTLLDQDDLSEDEDDFQDDFDFDDEDDDDLLLDDHTVITTNHNYTPIRYPSSPSPARQNYIPAYPKPGYAPENYQNCSRTPTVAQQYSQQQQQPQQAPPQQQQPQQQQQQQQQQQPHLRPSFFHGTNNGASWNYYNHHHHHHHPHHYDIGSHQQPQTIRCAENGKSYFELGSSNYCGPNRICGGGNNGGLGMMKNCCEGRNNLWCTAKQCYKEKRLKMMNLSMFKLARFRQASDQSLYRSVLICNTLKSLEKEIELENQTYHQRMQQQHRQALQQQSSMEFLQSFSARQQQQPQQQQPNASESNKQQNSGSSNLNNESSMINCNVSNNNNNNTSLGTCNNTSFSQPYTNNCIINRIPSFNDPMPIYEHHPLKDPSSGRATPFPASPGISQLVSSSNGANSDADSAFGDIDDVDSSSTRSIDWGSVLSLSSQSALDPLSNDIFTSTTSTSLTQTSSTITNLHVTISNGTSSSSGTNSSANTLSTSSAVSSSSPMSSSLSSFSSTSSTPISSIITTLTTVSSCSLESLTASSISVSQNVSNSNWDFPYIDTESSSNNSDYYELNCYKLSSALNQMDDFVKSDQLMTTSVGSVSPSSANEQLGTHIMVGS